eukprot:TRINITY_DN5760_c0_g1_i7.p2 TRINITY_DN5760_c0_g1~~TRINITY_DN5760_c0_g1_i7.p2  ORF type:complete len:304 (-),score=-26.36 TRINITY_DN5760_c0_g1_i7:427-1338(-)
MRKSRQNNKKPKFFIWAQNFIFQVCKLYRYQLLKLQYSILLKYTKNQKIYLFNKVRISSFLFAQLLEFLLATSSKVNVTKVKILKYDIKVCTSQFTKKIFSTCQNTLINSHLLQNINRPKLGGKTKNNEKTYLFILQMVGVIFSLIKATLQKLHKYQPKKYNYKLTKNKYNIIKRSAIQLKNYCKKSFQTKQAQSKLKNGSSLINFLSFLINFQMRNYQQINTNDKTFTNSKTKEKKLVVMQCYYQYRYQFFRQKKITKNTASHNYGYIFLNIIELIQIVLGYSNNTNQINYYHTKIYPQLIS